MVTGMDLKRGASWVRWIVVAMAAGSASAAPNAPAEREAGYSVTPACDTACLESLADRYLAALEARNPALLPWGERVRFSENNVMLHVGEGLWATVSGKSQQPLKVTDPGRGEVGILALVEQRGQPAFFAARLKVAEGKLVEVESLVNQPDPALPPSPGGGDPKAYFHYPHMFKVLPVSQRTPRRRMVDLANGYFSTLQLNDGKLFTVFSEDCRRQENGFESAGNPKFDRPEGKLSCGEQFKLGNFIFDSAVRDRDYMVVDEARGLVLSRAFIDHNAAATEGRLADGSRVKSWIRKPGSLSMLELFHITDGSIDRIEVVHIDVPFGMPSVWRRDPD